MISYINYNKLEMCKFICIDEMFSRKRTSSNLNLNHDAKGVFSLAKDKHLTHGSFSLSIYILKAQCGGLKQSDHVEPHHLNYFDGWI